jgi:pimeloyl-ACP methyl ester carboxylesterase
MFLIFGFKQKNNLLVTALTGLFLLASCVPAPAPQMEIQEIMILDDCVLSVPGMAGQFRGRCGKLPVPEDRRNPNGRQIQLNVAVIPAASQNPNPDPVFLLAGGPGQAATEAFVPLLSIFSQINFRRDLVLVDQRGTGQSSPLICPDVAVTEVELLGEELPIEEQQAQLQACLDSLDADPRNYTTPAAAEDLDEVRQALGYERINLLGISYGTRLAQVYLQQYPQQVRTMVLNGLVPQGWSIAGATMSADSERALNLIFERCKTDLACQQAFPDLDANFRDLLLRLDEAPVKMTLTHPMTGLSREVLVTRDLVASTVRLTTYSENYAALLPYLIHTAATEDNLQPIVAQYFISVEPSSEAMSTGLFLSVLCSEDVPFYHPDPARKTYYFQTPMETLQALCDVWPHEMIDPAFQQPVWSDVPVLLLSGEADPVTPPENADQVAEYLPNSLNLVAPGLGHNVIHQGCIPRIINQFIDQGTTDGLQVDCVQRLLPFPFFTSPIGPQP